MVLEPDPSVGSPTPWGPVTPHEPGTDVAERILDVALRRFVDQGIATTTMSQLAADAGISRVWLYHHYPNRDAVVRALLGREAVRFLGQVVAADDPSADAVDVVVNAIVCSIRYLRRHELLRQVLHSEPEVVAPYLATGIGPVLRLTVEAATDFLRRRAGMSPAEARASAETLVRVVLTILVNNDTTIDFDDPRQLRAWANRIVPRLLG